MIRFTYSYFLFRHAQVYLFLFTHAQIYLFMRDLLTRLPIRLIPHSHVI